MSDTISPPTGKAAARAMWALGDYPRFAAALMPDLGPELVEATGISVGDRVLDVATGAGAVAVPAAVKGAHVVACDIAPEHFPAARRAAAARGVSVEWVEADAEALPFPDGRFDVVTSCVGAMFAPDHRRVADELVRVCRPGGTIGMVNFTPDGLAAEFFALFGAYGPPPPEDFQPPVLWGSEAHVRALFGDRLAALKTVAGELVERMDGGPADYCAFYKATFGPVIATYAALADDPERSAALDRDFLAFATRANRGAPGGPCEYRYEYLRVLGRTRGT